MIEVVWLEDAVADLKVIGVTIAEDDPATGSLQHHPEMGRPGRVEETRERVVSGLPYILPYYIKKKEVRILAVMHTARKWPGNFPNKP